MSKILVEEKKLLKKHKEATLNLRYTIDNEDVLMRQYPGEWIAVYNQKVADHDKNFYVLWERLKSEYGEDEAFVACMEYMGKRDLSLHTVYGREGSSIGCPIVS